MVPFTVKLDDDIHKRIKIEAIKRGISMHGLIVGLISEGLERMEDGSDEMPEV